MMKQKTVLVVNQFNSDNLGDKLLNRSLCDSLELMGYKVVSCGFAQTTKQEVKYVENEDCSDIKTLIKNNIPESLKYIIKYQHRLKKEVDRFDINNVEAIIIGGGQLLKTKSVFLQCLEFWCDYAHKNDIPLYIFGIGVDDKLSITEINKYKNILKKSQFVNCRDEYSYKILTKVLGIECYVSPDIAFTHLIEKVDSKDIILVMPYSLITAQKAFGFSKSKEEYYSSIYDMIRKYEHRNYSIVITATTSSDARESLCFKKWAEKKNVRLSIEEMHTIKDMDELFSRAAVVISGRMHALIVGKICGAILEPIVISKKIEQFNNEYNIPSIRIEDIVRSSKEGLSLLLERMNNNE